MSKKSNSKSGFIPPRKNHVPDVPNEDNVNHVDNESIENNVGIEHLVNDNLDDDNDDDYIVENDIVVDIEDDRGLVEQDDNVVAWNIKGLYDDNGKPYRPRKLESNPPILVVSDSDGNEVNFLLTKNLSHQLQYSIDCVYRSYFGISSKSIHETDKAWWLKKTLPFIIIGVIFVFVLIISQL